MKLDIGKRFDPRLAAELKTQRASIVKGVACAAVTGALSALILVLVNKAVAILKLAGGSGVDLVALGRSAPSSSACSSSSTGSRAARSTTSPAPPPASPRTCASGCSPSSSASPSPTSAKRRAGAIQSVLTNDVDVYQSAVTIVRDSIDGPIKAIGAFGS